MSSIVEKKITKAVQKQSVKKLSLLKKSVLHHYQLYLLLLPVLLYMLVFRYIPMMGLQMAFKEVDFTRGLFGGEWIGLDNFKMFITRPNFAGILINTITISVFSLLFGFPFPILLAIMLNEVDNKHYRKLVQTATYAPHFISIVVLVSMVNTFLSPNIGVINKIVEAFGHNKINFLMEPRWFAVIYIVSHIWQHTGWNSIIYMSVLAGIDQEQHEAAVVDGATRFQRILYINIPYLIPTAILLFILASGHIMNVGFEKVFLLQNPANTESSDVISTYVYRMGIRNSEYGFASAVGLFNSVINFGILIFVNRIAKKLSDTSLF